MNLFSLLVGACCDDRTGETEGELAAERRVG
jgi:hypothetical protein